MTKLVQYLVTRWLKLVKKVKIFYLILCRQHFLPIFYWILAKLDNRFQNGLGTGFRFLKNHPKIRFSVPVPNPVLTPRPHQLLYRQPRLGDALAFWPHPNFPSLSHALSLYKIYAKDKPFSCVFCEAVFSAKFAKNMDQN